MVTIKYKIFSEGHDGCIIYPGIVPRNKTPHLFVTKISNQTIIENEKNVYDELPEEFNHLFYEKECYIHKFKKMAIFDENILKRIKQKENENNKYDAIMSIKLFDGIDLSNFLSGEMNINKEQVLNLLKKLIKLYKCMETLNTTYFIFHRDITPNNILYNPKMNEIRIIDFAQSQICPKGHPPPYLPKKDLDNTIDVINKVLIFYEKKFKHKLFKHVENIKEIERKF